MFPSHARCARPWFHGHYFIFNETEYLFPLYLQICMCTQETHKSCTQLKFLQK